MIFFILKFFFFFFERERERDYSCSESSQSSEQRAFCLCSKPVYLFGFVRQQKFLSITRFSHLFHGKELPDCNGQNPLFLVSSSLCRFPCITRPFFFFDLGNCLFLSGRELLLILTVFSTLNSELFH